MSHIFISYSTKNSDYAYKLADKLRDEGFNVWIDNAKLRASEDWWDSIVEALEEADAFIVIMTPESRASRWVQREITIFDNVYNGKRAFPLLLDGECFKIYSRTQFTDVCDDSLPLNEFYDDLARYTERKPYRGSDVVAQQPRVSVGDTTTTETILALPELDDDKNNIPLDDPPISKAPRQSWTDIPRFIFVSGVVIIILTFLVLLSGANAMFGGQSSTNNTPMVASEATGVVATMSTEFPSNILTELDKEATVSPTITPFATVDGSEFIQCRQITSETPRSQGFTVIGNALVDVCPVSGIDFATFLGDETAREQVELWVETIEQDIFDHLSIDFVPIQNIYSPYSSSSLEWYVATAYCRWTGANRLPTIDELYQLNAHLTEQNLEFGNIPEWTSDMNDEGIYYTFNHDESPTPRPYASLDVRQLSFRCVTEVDASELPVFDVVEIEEEIRVECEFQEYQRENYTLLHPGEEVRSEPSTDSEILRTIQTAGNHQQEGLCIYPNAEIWYAFNIDGERGWLQVSD